MRYSAILLALGGLALGGCGYQEFPGQGITNDYRSYVPMSAESVGTGEGSVSYVATKRGTVYVIDHNRYDKLKTDDNQHYAPHVIGSYLLMKGQGISVDGASQTITVGSIANTSPTVFKNPNISPDNSYELRLDPDKMD